MNHTMKQFLVWGAAFLFLAWCSHDTNEKQADVVPETAPTQEEIMQAKTMSKIYNFPIGEEYIYIHPIAHATAMVEWWDDVIFADPAEDIEKYKWYTPSIVFISHEHGDHFKNDVLEALNTPDVKFLASQSVYDQLSAELQANTTAMVNGDTLEHNGFTITAIPAYNIREEALGFHPEGRDNGYIFEKDGYRVYFSWDSEDTPEMRALEDIDIAFVSMNLPYTMSIESAISWVLDFAPTVVFPYHYRGKEGVADIEAFKLGLETQNSDISVMIHDWYSE